jgi:hypothetical protein
VSGLIEQRQRVDLAQSGELRNTTSSPLMDSTKPVLVGDVFTVPLNGALSASCQVVAAYGASEGLFYLAAFRSVLGSDDDADLDSIVGDEFALLALSTDQLLRSGDWQTIGNRPVDTERIPWPSYVVGVGPDEYAVEDCVGNVQGVATPEQVAELGFRPVIKATGFETALKALHGLAPWEPGYSAFVVP